MGKAANSSYVPANFPGGAWFTTRGNCNDINVILDAPSLQSVRVCFKPRSGSPYCQANYKSIARGQWTVVATGVAPGTSYKLHFLTNAVANGRVAT